MQNPNLQIELKYIKDFEVIFGLDEVGRGPLAGPLTVTAVGIKTEKILKEEKELLEIGIKDSKKLTEKRRIKIVEQARPFLQDLFTIHISNEQIDQIGIAKSFQKACLKIANQISQKYKKTLILSDYFTIKKLPKNLKNLAIKNGDNISLSISLAAIFAKVSRDNLMQKLHKEFPFYHWDKNKGYGTNSHIQAIKEKGISKYHRKTFLKKILSSKYI